MVAGTGGASVGCVASGMSARCLEESEVASDGATTLPCFNLLYSSK